MKLSVGPEVGGRFAELAVAAIHREYPSHITHYLRSDGDVRPPRELTPAFYGSFDWHSAVHGHWCLVRLLRCCPGVAFEERARAALSESLTRAKIEAEVAYVSAPGRQGFERPYGLAWLLQLCAELREWPDPDAVRWHSTLAQLETIAVERLSAWLAKLPWPVRSGVHSQSAFALGLMRDWARAAGDRDLAGLIEQRSRAFYGEDADAPIRYEPSGHDFLSPILGEADLMRRVLDSGAYVRWFDRFLPNVQGADARAWLTPASSPDRADGHLAHLEGLNLSRAWMLEGVVSALPATHPAHGVFRAAALANQAAGLAAVSGEHYAGAHWLASFATYLVTGRGVSDDGPATRS